MKEHNRFIVLGDGIIYRCGESFYTTGSSQLDFYEILEGITEVVFWGRIQDISSENVGRYSRYEVENFSKNIRFEGTVNQSLEETGYIKSMPERYRKLKKLLSEKPSIIMCAPFSLSTWIMWYLVSHKNLLFISRNIGDVECTLFLKKKFTQIYVLVGKYTFKKYLKKCLLQTWVSNALEAKYAVRGIPSLVFHDCLVSESQIAKQIKTRTSEELKIIFVGRLSLEKGIFDLLSAIGNLRELQINLDIVGEGNEEEHLKKKIVEMQIEGKVKLLGYRKWGESLFCEMRKADCLILPSYSEGLGMVLLEAMGQGLTVIASNIGGIPEVVKHRVNGLLFEAGNVKELTENMKILYYDEDMRRELSQNALITASKNTREKQLEKFQGYYEKYVYKNL